MCGPSYKVLAEEDVRRPWFVEQPMKMAIVSGFIRRCLSTRAIDVTSMLVSC